MVGSIAAPGKACGRSLRAARAALIYQSSKPGSVCGDRDVTWLKRGPVVLNVDAAAVVEFSAQRTITLGPVRLPMSTMVRSLPCDYAPSSVITMSKSLVDSLRNEKSG